MYINDIDIDKDIIKRILTIPLPSEFIYSTIGTTHSSLFILNNLIAEKISKNASIINIEIKNSPQVINNLKFSLPIESAISIKIPETVILIGESACSELTFSNLMFNNASLLNLELNKNSFYNCNFINEFIFPNNCKVIHQKAFAEANFQGGIQISYKAKLETIEKQAFEMTNFNTETLILPKGLKKIQEKAFFNCRGIKKIEFIKNSDIKQIDEAAFANSSLKEVIIKSKNDVIIEQKCFFYCKELAQLDISQTKITTIPPSFCKFCSSLKNINLPTTLKTIKEYAFSNCILSELDPLPELKEIEKHAFANNNLISIPSSILKTINFCGKKAFSYNCFTELTLEAPINPKSISSEIFSYNSWLKKITLVNSDTTWVEINKFMFYCCCELEEINIPDTITILSSGCFSCTKIKKIELHNLKQLESLVFDNCKNLEECDFSNSSFTKIKEYTFNSAESLKKITLPNYISKIAENAFHNVDKVIIDEIYETYPFLK